METKSIEPAGKKETCIELGKFRLTNGLRLTSTEPMRCEYIFEYISAAEELALEAKTGETSYYVIAFIEYNKKEECCDMRTVGTRFIEAVKTDKDWHDARALIRIANEFIEAANQVEEDY